MRVRVLAILSLLLCCLLPSGHAVARSTAVPPGTLVFADEFNAASLDSTAWIALNRPGDASNSEQQCYLPGNAVEAGGLLTLTDRADSSCSGYSYTSAMVQTKSYTFTYGTLEVRAQMPRGQGQWPALWLLGANCQASNILSANNSGPCAWPLPGSNEIDLMESLNTATTVGKFSLFTGTAPNNPNQSFSCGTTPLPFDTSTALHTYDLIWAPGSLTWQVDGVTYCSTASNVPTTPMFILLNIALGGSATGSAIDTSVLPQHMAIDYVRVYQTAAGTPTNTPTGPTATATRAATRTATATPVAGGTLGSTTITGGELRHWWGFQRPGRDSGGHRAGRGSRYQPQCLRRHH